MVAKRIPVTTSRSRLGTAETESLGSAQHVLFCFSPEEEDFFLVCGAYNLSSRVWEGENTGILNIGPFLALLNFTVSV